MTTDERLEHLKRTVDELAKTGDERTRRLDERLGAIAESLELLILSQRKTDRLVSRLGRYIRAVLMDHEGRLLELEGEDDDQEERDDGEGDVSR
jgi:hypothetical protein